MKCSNKKCLKSKLKYAYSFIQEHVYMCKNCNRKTIVKRNIKELIGNG